MVDPNQTLVPDSFVALFATPGQSRPRESREFISGRYELCEDLANHLFEYARAQHLDLGISEDEVLRRCELGLRSDSSGLNEAEGVWVIRRLAELEGWPWAGATR
jgi:hypothetical protein